MTGPTGQTGATGRESTVTGPTGQTGATGRESTVTGPTGQTGPTGATSTTTGPSGATGATGATSTVTGPTGVTGPSGANSNVTGPTGQPGKDSVKAGPTGFTGPTGVTGPYEPQHTLFSVASCANTSSFVGIFPTDIVPWTIEENAGIALAECGQRFTFLDPDVYGGIGYYRVPYSQQRMTLSGFVTLETATNLVVQVGLSTGIDGLDSLLAQTNRLTSGPFSLS